MTGRKAPRPRASRAEYDQEQRVPKTRRGEALHSTNVGVGSAVFSAAWGLASVLGHLPGVVAIVGASLGGGLVVWQAVKAKVEQVRQDRERDANPGG